MTYNALDHEIHDGKVIIVSYVGTHTFNAVAEWVVGILAEPSMPPKFSAVVDLKRADTSWSKEDRTHYLNFLNRYVARINRLAFVVNSEIIFNFIQKGIDQGIAFQVPLASQMKIFYQRDDAIGWAKSTVK
jgi:hypothetical protein